MCVCHKVKSVRQLPYCSSMCCQTLKLHYCDFAAEDPLPAMPVVEHINIEELDWGDKVWWFQQDFSRFKTTLSKLEITGGKFNFHENQEGLTVLQVDDVHLATGVIRSISCVSVIDVGLFEAKHSTQCGL